MKTRRIIPYILSLLLLTGFFWQVGFVQRQATLELTSVKVGLFPEYDQPGVLVVLNIALSEAASSPRFLTFQVPAESEILSVAWRTPDGERIALSHEISETGKWKDLRFATDAQTIQIEYQDPNLLIEEARRFYNYQWLAVYPAETLSITVRQPLGAGQIQAEPALGRGEKGPGDATYYTYEVGPVPAGELFTLNLMYTKDTANLADPELKVAPVEPINDTTPGRTPSPLSVIMWLLTVAIAVLLLVSLYYWWFKANIMEKREGMIQGVGILNPEKQAVFCHECGMRSRPMDSYCSNCGTELRRPPKKTL